jgi:hypothetical protein
MGAQVLDCVTEGLQDGDEVAFHLESGVIGAYRYPHGVYYVP